MRSVRKIKNRDIWENFMKLMLKAFLLVRNSQYDLVLFSLTEFQLE